MNADSIWIFHGINGRFSSGVFTEVKLAEEWIFRHKLTGVLTEYPINVGCYDWALENDLFQPKKDEYQSSEFIGKFTTAGQEHFHYEDGVRG